MLVALTILAVAGAALFGWVFQISTQLQRLNNQQVQSLAQLRSLHYLSLVNPVATPRGRQEFSDFVLSWEASALTPMRPTLNANDAPLATAIAVYDVVATMQRDDRPGAWLVFRTRLAGWRTVADGSSNNAAAGPGVSGGGEPK